MEAAPSCCRGVFFALFLGGARRLINAHARMLAGWQGPLQGTQKSEILGFFSQWGSGRTGTVGANEPAGPRKRLGASSSSNQPGLNPSLAF